MGTPRYFPPLYSATGKGYEISLTEFPEAQKDNEDGKVRRSDIEKKRLDGKSKLIRTNPRARVL